MTNNYDLISIGSCTLDCIISVKDILRFELFEKEIVKKYTAIEYSRKLNVENMRFVPGGSGANIAADCAMLGLKSTYIGVLGNDFSAQICLEDLKKRGVDTSNIKQTDEDKTAFSLIVTFLLPVSFCENFYWMPDCTIAYMLNLHLTGSAFGQYILAL